MRITLTVTSAGDCWAIGGLPRIDLKKCYPVGAHGERFDENAFRSAVRNHHNIQFSDGDRGVVCAFATLLLSSISDWYADMDKNDGTDADVTRAAKRLSRRAKGGKCGRVRIDLKPIRYQRTSVSQPVRTVEVRIVHDDFGIPSAERFDRDCAMMVADFCRGYSQKFTERGEAPLVFASETAALLAALHERTEQEGGGNVM